MGKTFHLKRKADHFTGTAGKDNFLAPTVSVDGLDYATWTNRDVLEGGRGSDTITAHVEGASLTPRMKSIEKAVLSRTSTDALALDLAKAGNLRAITLDDFHSDATISHAARLKSFSMFNAGSFNAIQLQGLDAAKIGTASYLFGNSIMSLDVQTLNDISFNAVNLSLTDSNITLSGDIGAQDVVIHSNGVVNVNYLAIDGDAFASTETITVDGAAELIFTPGKLDKLVSFDASALTKYMEVTLDAASLTSLKGSSGDDYIILASLGGDVDGEAMVDLGAGGDILDVQAVALDPVFHSFIGGDGYDNARISGGLQNVAQAFEGFERLIIHGASGTYDMSGSLIGNVAFYDLQADVILNNMADLGYVNFYNNSAMSTSVHVSGANGSDTDVLRLNLYGVTIGSTTTAFSAPGLSNLVISSSGLVANATNTLYLGEIGSDIDPVTIAIYGDKHFTLHAADNAAIRIDQLTINNAAGVDILGLANGASAFVATGALINGWVGNDVLVGGEGGDTFNTNGGDDIVHGSLGADTINLEQGAGQDTFIFSDAAHSTLSAMDTINGFGGNDLIHVGNLAPSVVFAGNVATENDGLALLSLTEATAFYATDAEMLFVDLDHDGAINDGADLVVHLTGLAAFSDVNIVANVWPI